MAARSYLLPHSMLSVSRRRAKLNYRHGVGVYHHLAPMRCSVALSATNVRAIYKATRGRRAAVSVRWGDRPMRSERHLVAEVSGHEVPLCESYSGALVTAPGATATGP
ncbi:hypothetical protein GCM10027174_45730 [Salinifilum aidingensis]